MLPQPFVTIAEAKSPALRTALDLTEEWAKVSPDSQLITGVVVVRNSFATEHPDAVTQFMKDYAPPRSGSTPSPPMPHRSSSPPASCPIRRSPRRPSRTCYITFVAGDEMKSSLSGYLQVLFDADPKSVGGSMPGDDFYFAG